MAAPAERPIWALVGLRCSGKTSVGRELARLRGCEPLDLDEELARRHGAANVGELLRSSGVATFRALEKQALADALALERPLVLSTGGGVVELAENRQLLRARTLCLWLREELDELSRRIALAPWLRPALEGSDPVAELPAIAARRDPWYAEVAHLTLQGQGRAPLAQAQALLDAAPRASEKG